VGHPVPFLIQVWMVRLKERNIRYQRIDNKQKLKSTLSIASQKVRSKEKQQRMTADD